MVKALLLIHIIGIKIYGKIVLMVKFSDDIVMIAESEDDIIRIVDEINEMLRTLEMKIYNIKTKIHTSIRDSLVKTNVYLSNQVVYISNKLTKWYI